MTTRREDSEQDNLRPSVLSATFRQLGAEVWKLKVWCGVQSWSMRHYNTPHITW